MEFLDRERLDEGWPVLGRDDSLAIGLVEVRRRLGEEFAIRDAGRGVEAGLLLDARG
jgi:hypothetical protein